jgi:replicative DNA helicase
MTSPCCANWCQFGAIWSNSAMDTSESVEPMDQIEQAEAALYKVAEGASAPARHRALPWPRTALGMIETALLSGGHISGKTTGLVSINEKDRRAAR